MTRISGNSSVPYNTGEMLEGPKPAQLRTHVTPVPEFNPPFLYVSDPIVQRSPDRSQPAVVLRDVNVWMALKTDGTDSRYNGGGPDTESFEQTVFCGPFVHVTDCERSLMDAHGDTRM